MTPLTMSLLERQEMRGNIAPMLSRRSSRSFRISSHNRVGLGGQVAFAVRNKYDLFPRNLGLVGLRITF